MELLIAGSGSSTRLDGRSGPWLGDEDADTPIVFVSRSVVGIAILGIMRVVETMGDG